MHPRLIVVLKLIRGSEGERKDQSVTGVVGWIKKNQKKSKKGKREEERKGKEEEGGYFSWLVGTHPSSIDQIYYLRTIRALKVCPVSIKMTLRYWCRKIVGVSLLGRYPAGTPAMPRCQPNSALEKELICWRVEIGLVFWARSATSFNKYSVTYRSCQGPVCSIYEASDALQHDVHMCLLGEQREQHCLDTFKYFKLVFWASLCLNVEVLPQDLFQLVWWTLKPQIQRLRVLATDYSHMTKPGTTERLKERKRSCL